MVHERIGWEGYFVVFESILNLLYHALTTVDILELGNDHALDEKLEAQADVLTKVLSDDLEMVQLPPHVLLDEPVLKLNREQVVSVLKLANAQLRTELFVSRSDVDAIQVILHVFLIRVE